MTKLFKWLLFISSYAPLYVLIALDNYDFSITPIAYLKDVILIGRQLAFWITMLVLLIVSFLAIGYYRWISLNDNKVLSDLKPLNESVLSYLITYVVPLTAMEVDSVNSVVVNVLLFIIIGVVYVNSNLVYLNILLILMGYRVYSDAEENVIITNYSKNEITISIGEVDRLPCREVTKGIYLIRKPR